METETESFCQLLVIIGDGRRVLASELNTKERKLLDNIESINGSIELVDGYYKKVDENT